MKLKGIDKSYRQISTDKSPDSGSSITLSGLYEYVSTRRDCTASERMELSGARWNLQNWFFDVFQFSSNFAMTPRFELFCPWLPRWNYLGGFPHPRSQVQMGKKQGKGARRTNKEDESESLVRVSESLVWREEDEGERRLFKSDVTLDCHFQKSHPPWHQEPLPLFPTLGKRSITNTITLFRFICGRLLLLRPQGRRTEIEKKDDAIQATGIVD